jgi:flagellar motility protein MotE (MotC chaperone)
MEETQLSSLVKTYESMKPEDAARIFNRLERGILVDVAHRMKPAKIGAVLAAMEPARAQDLTVLLARRLKVTQGGVVNGAGEVASSSGPNG